MYIQCFIKKADGSPVFVDFEGVRYIFQVNQWGDAVSFVGNQRHAARLLMMGDAVYREYEPPEAVDPAGGITEVGAMPVPLGNVQRQQPKPQEPLPDNLSVDESLDETQGDEPAVKPDHTPPQEDGKEPVEVEWAPAAIKSKVNEFRPLNEVNFISWLTANKDRIMNWPLSVRTEVAKKISNKLPGYNPEAEGIEGFKLDDYHGGGTAGDS